jgi:hypothetical protein
MDEFYFIFRSKGNSLCPMTREKIVTWVDKYCNEGKYMYENAETHKGL